MERPGSVIRTRPSQMSSKLTSQHPGGPMWTSSYISGVCRSEYNSVRIYSSLIRLFGYSIHAAGFLYTTWHVNIRFLPGRLSTYKRRMTCFLQSINQYSCSTVWKKINTTSNIKLCFDQRTLEPRRHFDPTPWWSHPLMIPSLDDPTPDKYLPIYLSKIFITSMIHDLWSMIHDPWSMIMIEIGASLERGLRS